MASTAKKTGKEFEALISCINEQLHSIATVTPNDRILDRDTGKPRQIDIAIRLSDGPSEFLGIIEIRDHKRPIGKGYVEEINSKRNSVGADRAWIVSKSGFWKSALTKAAALGIGAITYQEALREDWSDLFKYLRSSHVQYRRFDDVTVYFLRKGTKEIINPYPEMREAVRANKDELVLFDSEGSGVASLNRLAADVINSIGERIYVDMHPGETGRTIRIHHTGGFAPQLFFRDETGSMQPVEDLLVRANVWVEEIEYPVSMRQYRDASTNEVHAEVVESPLKVGDKSYTMELIALEPGKNDSEETTIMVRVRGE